MKIDYMTYEEDQRKIFNSRMSAATRNGLQKGMERGITEIAKKCYIKILILN